MSFFHKFGVLVNSKSFCIHLLLVTSLKEEYSVRKTLRGKLGFLKTVFTYVVLVLIKK